MKEKKKKLDLLINKKLNLFVFIGILSDVRNGPWNKERSNFWIKKSGGKLSEKEIEALENFRILFSKYDYSITESQFLCVDENCQWPLLKKIFNKEDLDKLEEIFKIFSSRFNKIWSVELIKLLKVRDCVKSNYRQMGLTFKIIEDLCSLKKDQNFKENLPIYFVMSSSCPEDFVGWYSIFNKKIDIVLENSNLKSSNFLIAIIAHEFFHLAIKHNKKIIDKLEKISSQNETILRRISKEISPRMVLEELLLSSFVPEGYLANHCLGLKVKKSLSLKDHKTGKFNLVLSRRYIADKMKDLAREYILEKRQIDENYLNNIILEIKKAS